MPLAPGLYDLPELRRRIEEREQRFHVQTERLDPGDANERLARHLADVVRAILLTIPEDERPARQVEIVNELLATLETSAPAWSGVPLALHARYSLDEVTAAIGRSSLARPVRLQGGVLWDEATNADWLFITLDKSENHYSPTTRYRDYAISPQEFHWESQGITREASETGQRYIHHARRGSQVFLFVRPARKLDGNRTAPYTFLGPAEYVRHSGEQPMSIVWRLRYPMPLDFFRKAKVAADSSESLKNHDMSSREDRTRSEIPELRGARPRYRFALRMKTTAYFEEQVLRKRSYLRRNGARRRYAHLTPS